MLVCALVDVYIVHCVVQCGVSVVLDRHLQECVVECICRQAWVCRGMEAFVVNHARCVWLVVSATAGVPSQLHTLCLDNIAVPR